MDPNLDETGKKTQGSTPVYPIYLTNLDRVRCVVVGGGPIGERKVRGLLAGGARVQLIAPQATPQLQQWAEEGRLDWLPRPFTPTDLDDVFLVVAATDRRLVNNAIAEEAHLRGILCNVADRAEEGNFHTPATLRLSDETIDGNDDGDEAKNTSFIEIIVALGSSGKEPRRVKELRGWLQQIWHKRPSRVSKINEELVSLPSSYREIDQTSHE